MTAEQESVNSQGQHIVSSNVPKMMLKNIIPSFLVLGSKIQNLALTQKCAYFQMLTKLPECARWIKTSLILEKTELKEFKDCFMFFPKLYFE